MSLDRRLLDEFFFAKTDLEVKFSNNNYVFLRLLYVYRDEPQVLALEGG